jgi:hypothetical protein
MADQLRRWKFWFGAAACATASIVTAPAAQTSKSVPLSQAKIFLELNHTDGDLGLHADIDGEPWRSLEIEGPGESLLLSLLSRGKLAAHGLTQLALESAEPSFDELSPARFFRRFPEGRYEIDARGLDGSEIEGVATLSHILAAPPGNILVSGVIAAENCDATLPQVNPPVEIRWDPVTTSHPEIGKTGPVKIEKYQFFVEGAGATLSLDLPPTVTRVEIPELITRLGKAFKFEIIARTTRGNNTAVESCFTLF